MEYTAIDFETANSEKPSICSVGIANFTDGILQDSFYSLINPETYFDDMNVSITGINSDTVKKSPTFSEAYSEIKKYLKAPLVAHNATFDFGQLNAEIKKYNLSLNKIEYFDSLPIARTMLGLKHNRLKDLVKYFNCQSQNTHNALDDAKACGEVVWELLKINNGESVEQLIQDNGFNNFGTLSHKKWNKFSQGNYHTIDPNRFYLDINGNKIKLNEKNKTKAHLQNKDLNGKSFVFSGTLNTFTRSEVQKFIENNNGEIKKGVTANVNYLVVGLEDPRVVGEDGKSSKIKKAESLQEKGKKIKIISEDEFIKMFNR